LSANWDVYRLPVAFSLIRPKSHREYQPENVLFREMVSHFRPPTWAKRIIVEGDAAYGSQDNMKMVQKRDAADPDRRWGFVFAIARTWKTVEGKALKDLVTYTPRTYYQRTRVPRLPGAHGRVAGKSVRKYTLRRYAFFFQEIEAKSAEFSTRCCGIPWGWRTQPGSKAYSP
jgi:hypothetical protein